MTLHEAMQADLDAFLNAQEFAQIVELDGVNITAIMFDSSASLDSASAGGFSNASSLGLMQCARTLLCRVADIEEIPSPGQRLIVNGETWIAGDGIASSEGLLRLPLTRAFA